MNVAAAPHPRQARVRERGSPETPRRPAPDAAAWRGVSMGVLRGVPDAHPQLVRRGGPGRGRGLWPVTRHSSLVTRLRLLLVTYYFPPSGGAGVQRTLKFAKYLRAAGVEPVVLTVEAGAYPSLDPTLAADVPDGVEVVRTRALDPFGLYGALTGRSRRDAVAVGSVAGADSLGQRLGLWARANVFLPDARVGWAPFAARAARQIVRAGRADAVLTSGPPHSTHLVGLALRRLLADRGVPWYRRLPRPVDRHQLLRRAPDVPPRPCVRRGPGAACAPVRRRRRDGQPDVGARAGGEGRARAGRRPRDPERVRPRGLRGARGEGEGGTRERPRPPRAAPPRPGAFTLVHVGSLYGSRNPETLWAAVAALRERGGPQTGGAGRLRIRLVGRVDGAIRASLDRYGLGEVIDEAGVVTHAEAVAEMAAADLLFLSIEPVANADGILTGKLYEYLASGRPVLALGPPDGDAARLLRDVSGGRPRALGRPAAVEARSPTPTRHGSGTSPRRAPRPRTLAPLARPAQARALADLVRGLV